MSPALERLLATEVIDGVAVVSFLKKEIKYENEIEKIREELFGLIGVGGHDKVLLNLSNAEFLASMILDPLARVHTRLVKVGGQLRLCNVDHHSVQELLKISGFNKILKIDKDEVTALAKF